MKLYLISRKGPTDYDEYDAMVIRADTPLHARQLAGEHNPSDEELWLSAEKSTCRPLTDWGKARVILGSFNAG